MLVYTLTTGPFIAHAMPLYIAWKGKSRSVLITEPPFPVDSQWTPRIPGKFSKMSQWVPVGSIPFPPCSYLIPTSFPPHSHLIPSEFPMNSICSRHQYKLLLAMKYVCLHMFSSCDRHTTMIMWNDTQYGCCLASFF